MKALNARGRPGQGDDSQGACRSDSGAAMPAAARTLPLSELTWVATDDGGRAARIEIHSPDATALRVAMQLPATDPDLSVRFAGAGADAKVFGPIPANTIAQDTATFGKFWTPVLEGDVATIEFHAGADVVLTGVTLTLPQVSHQVVGNAESARAVAPRPSAKLATRRAATSTSPA